MGTVHFESFIDQLGLAVLFSLYEQSRSSISLPPRSILELHDWVRLHN